MARQIKIVPPRSHWCGAEDTQFHVVLVHPEIPPNTGNIARLCAATGAHLHLVEPLGFALEDRYLRRAGLDYWPAVEVTLHASLDDLALHLTPSRWRLFTTRGERHHSDLVYQPGDVLMFGRETRGLGEALCARYPDQLVRIPMRPGAVRSLNLANAVAIGLYEALRQQDFDHLIAEPSTP